MSIEDIPIFYLCSQDKANEWWWGFTGNGSDPLPSTQNFQRHRVYFTDEFLHELIDRTCFDCTEYWELSSSPGVLDKRLKTFEGWVIKWSPPHMAGYVWTLSHQRGGDRAYVLGVWPD